jgi:hypothetical protein
VVTGAGKATRLRSCEVERPALEAAVEQNYRPATRGVCAGGSKCG